MPVKRDVSPGSPRVHCDNACRTVHQIDAELVRAQFNCASSCNTCRVIDVACDDDGGGGALVLAAFAIVATLTPKRKPIPYLMGP